jgi:hypothetical protein
VEWKKMRPVETILRIGESRIREKDRRSEFN